MEKFTDFYEESMSKMEAEEMKKPELEEQKVESFVAQVCEGEEQQLWYKHAKKEVGLNAETLRDGEWPYDPELEHLVEESEGRIGSNVVLLMYLT
jgi:hypothetical protein